MNLEFNTPTIELILVQVKANDINDNINDSINIQKD